MAGKKAIALKVHVAIQVRDVGRSVDFYRRLFGIEPSKIRRGYAKFDVANPPVNFTLHEIAHAGPGALSHLGIQVSSSEDVLTMRDGWKAAGLETRDEMQTECCFALQDKAWVRDPDGNEWEVFAVLREHLPEKPAARPATERGCCEPACCVPGGSVKGTPMPQRYNVLFLCTGNSSRSILAEAILTHRGGPNFAAFSAGSHPTGYVHPQALATLEAARLPTARLRSKSWEEFGMPGAPKMDFVFTVCDSAAKEVCPLWPGQPMTAHWGIPDPGGAPPDRLDRAFLDAFATLDRRIGLFLCLPLSSIEKLAIQKSIDQIGKQ